MVLFECIFEFLDEKFFVVDLEIVMFLEDMKGKVEFKYVLFFYDGKWKVLNNVLIDIKEGQMVVLVGYIGSGKMFIVNLIICFYDVNEG